MLVHVVADYGPAVDLAFAEVAQRLRAELPGATIVATPVGPFDTLAAGFVVAQLALGRRVRATHANNPEVLERLKDYENLES